MPGSTVKDMSQTIFSSVESTAARQVEAILVIFWEATLILYISIWSSSDALRVDGVLKLA